MEFAEQVYGEIKACNAVGRRMLRLPAYWTLKMIWVSEKVKTILHSLPGAYWMA